MRNVLACVDCVCTSACKCKCVGGEAGAEACHGVVRVCVFVCACVYAKGRKIEKERDKERVNGSVCVRARDRTRACASVYA